MPFGRRRISSVAHLHAKARSLGGHEFMNTSILRLAALAALIFASTVASRAASMVTIPLSGAVVRSGSNILLSATTPIDHADVYYYEISGTCHGTGNLESFVPAGTDFVAALHLVDPGLVPYLQGTVLDVKNTFPFTCVSKTASGSLPAFHLKGTIHIKAGIDKNGLCLCDLTAIRFKVGQGTDKTDTIVIDNGQCLVQVSPFAGDAQPDLFFREPSGKLVGQGLFNFNGGGQSEEVNLSPGQHFTNIVVLRNYSSATDSYTLSTVQPGAGFTEKFIYAHKDVTAAIEAGTFVIPKVKPGGTKTLSWKMTNVSATSGTSLNGGVFPRLTATSATDSTKLDAVAFWSIVP